MRTQEVRRQGHRMRGDKDTGGEETRTRDERGQGHRSQGNMDTGLKETQGHRRLVDETGGEERGDRR